jgi:transcriptional regulator with XRE-family HTH domain
VQNNAGGTALQASDIKALRESAGMTREQLAEEIGIGYRYLGELERGEKPIDEKKALAIQHVTSPVRFWAEAKLAPDLMEMAHRLIKHLADDNTGGGKVVGIVRMGDGRFMLGMQPEREA